MNVEIQASDRMATSLDNNPPPPTPLEQAREDLSLLELESGNWFDGAPIENEVQATAVAKLLDDARKAKARFDKERKTEKAPHEAAGKAVDAAWKPLSTSLDQILECARKAQTGWLIKLDQQQREAARLAREEAEAKQAIAQKLAAESKGSLDAARARDDAIEEAKRAEQAAQRADKATPGAKAEGMARAVGLRTYYSAKIDDRRALLNFIAQNDPAALIAFVEDWANKAVRAGAKSIDGVTIVSERRA